VDLTRRVDVACRALGLVTRPSLVGISDCYNSNMRLRLGGCSYAPMWVSVMVVYGGSRGECGGSVRGDPCGPATASSVSLIPDSASTWFWFQVLRLWF